MSKGKIYLMFGKDPYKEERILYRVDRMTYEDGVFSINYRSEIPHVLEKPLHLETRNWEMVYLEGIGLTVTVL